VSHANLGEYAPSILVYDSISRRANLEKGGNFQLRAGHWQFIHFMQRGPTAQRIRLAQPFGFGVAAEDFKLIAAMRQGMADRSDESRLGNRKRQ